jgi:hypothetical protein
MQLRSVCSQNATTASAAGANDSVNGISYTVATAATETSS